MTAPKDYLGNEILVGDILFVALLWGRSATLSTRKVLEILPDGRIRVEGTGDVRHSWDKAGTGKGILNYSNKTLIDMGARNMQ